MKFMFTLCGNQPFSTEFEKFSGCGYINGSTYKAKFHFNIIPLGKIYFKTPNDCPPSRQMEIMFLKLTRREFFSEL